MVVLLTLLFSLYKWDVLIDHELSCSVSSSSASLAHFPIYLFLLIDL